MEKTNKQTKKKAPIDQVMSETDFKSFIYLFIYLFAFIYGVLFDSRSELSYCH